MSDEREHRQRRDYPIQVEGRQFSVEVDFSYDSGGPSEEDMSLIIRYLQVTNIRKASFTRTGIDRVKITTANKNGAITVRELLKAHPLSLPFNNSWWAKERAVACYPQDIRDFQGKLKEMIIAGHP